MSAPEPGPLPELLPVVRASELEEPCPERRWLVDTLWARAGVGIIGGAAKTFKSWLGLDLALSVASDSPCLDVFDVHDPGPALIYMAEDDAPTVKARLSGLCRHRGLKEVSERCSYSPLRLILPDIRKKVKTRKPRQSGCNLCRGRIRDHFPSECAL